MLKHALYGATLSMVILLPISAYATESPVSQSNQPKTMPYGDNPNIFRVLTYKAGQGITHLGDSMQRGADQSSAKISEKWQETKAYRSEQSQVAQAKATEAKTYTQQKWQQTKDAVTGTHAGTVPIEQGNLSQPSNAQTTLSNSTTPAISSPVGSTTPLPESANP